MPTISGNDFLGRFCDVLPTSFSDPPDDGATAWNVFMQFHLAEAAAKLEAVHCSSSRVDRPAGALTKVDWKHREYRFDGTWFSKEPTEFEQPCVLIEHENGWNEGEFLYDFWKLCFGFAPLRIMIGYCNATTGDRHAIAMRRLISINKLIESNKIRFPAGTEDLVLLGQFPMPTPRDFHVFRRLDGQESFVDCRSLSSFRNS